jgi:uncharacterized protein YjbI with pentapeptide repeats
MNTSATLQEHKAWLHNNGGKRANLSGADLRRADLIGADLSWANLIGANLSGANLRRAKDSTSHSYHSTCTVSAEDN